MNEKHFERKEPFEHEKKPNEGREYFYNDQVLSEKIKGLEYAIKMTEERLAHDSMVDKEVFEKHLADLKKRLEEAKKGS